MMKKPFFLLGYKDDKYSLTDIRSLVLIVVGMVIGIIVLAAWPFIAIWALNVLFNLGIAYSFKTWLAVAVILFTIKGTLSFKKEDK